MKVQLKDDIESAHQWIDDDGNRHTAVIAGKKGQTLDSKGTLPLAGKPAAPVGDAERALRKLVKLGHAIERK